MIGGGEGMLKGRVFGLPLIVMMKSGIEIHGRLIAEDQNSLTLIPTNSYSGSKNIDIKERVVTIPFSSVDFTSSSCDDVMSRIEDSDSLNNLIISIQNGDK